MTILYVKNVQAHKVLLKCMNIDKIVENLRKDNSSGGVIQTEFVKFMEENQVLIQRARYSDAYRTNTEWVIEYTVTENVVNSGLDRHDLNPPSFLDIFFRKFE